MTAPSAPRELAQDPNLRAILVALIQARTELLKAPATSNGRRAVEAHLLAAGRLLGLRVGDGPNIADMEAALNHAQQAMRRQLVMATQLLDEPIAAIRTMWNMPSLPERTAREIGGALRDAANNALAVLEHNAPLIAATWGSAVQGLGLGAIVGLGILAYLLFK